MISQVVIKLRWATANFPTRASPLSLVHGDRRRSFHQPAINRPTEVMQDVVEVNGDGSHELEKKRCYEVTISRIRNIFRF